MLKTMTKGACALAAAMTFAGAAAHAENHVVEIVDGAYLPIISYVNPGDSITFANETDQSRTVSGPGESWTSGPIGAGGSFVLEIESETPKTFSGADGEGVSMAGEYTFEPAPND